jgi:hypothetical protein
LFDYNRAMLGTKWFTICLLLLGCLVATSAQAASLHAHVQAKSPFESSHLKQDHHPRHSLHCALMGHHIDKPCPHYNQKKAEGGEFTLPCHDGTSPASIAGPSGVPVFTHAFFQWDPVSPKTFWLSGHVLNHSFDFVSVLEHPPRFI